MLTYRLYFLDAAGRITRAEPFHANDDRAAEAQAVTHWSGQAMELWNQARVVRTWRPDAGMISSSADGRRAAAF